MYVIKKGTVKNPSSTLIQFKPRQVILAEKHQTLSSSASDKLNLMALVEKSKPLTADDKAQLLHSVFRYLQSNQFSKALKRLLKDAQIQGDSWKAGTLDLEDIYCKYLGNCNHVDAKATNLKELDAVASQETVSKKNKKKTDENDSDSEVDKLSKKQKKKNKNKITSESLHQDATQSELKSGLTEDKLKIDNGEVDNSETAKSKHKKKKNKPSAEPLVEDQKLSNSKNSSLVDAKNNGDIPLEESEVKPKEKKRKKEEKEKKSFVASDNGVDDTNDSKKRKRLPSSENESQPIEESVPGETKRRKIEGSAEPKTVNAFQRVKIDEVEFVDERLQDNSYWAKDGADVGYGAKAQEILGQVRGKDFRHEKTKKKRGSYRGGQIDLQSHSVKFNYSDEE